MRAFRKLAFAAAATAVAAVMGASPAFAQKTMRIAHLNPDSPFDSHSGAMAAVFKNLVETATNGGIKVQIFANGQLGKDNEVIQQVRDGIVESVISSSGGVASHYKMVGVFDLPFAFPNIAVADKVIDKDSDFGKKFTADLQAKTGLKVLGLLDSGGFFAFSNNKKPITSAADMSGLRIRTMTLPTHEAIVRSLGGQPTALPWAEVYTALQTGVADGQMNPVPIIAFAKFDEVQKYLSITNHVITPYLWFVNQKFYDSLTPEKKEAICTEVKGVLDAIGASHGNGQRKAMVMVDDRIADSIFQQIQTRPADYSILATLNLNGDYISDAAAAVVGGLGMAPGANIGDTAAIFEATHGTAPKHAGLDRINPGSVILSGVMMLEYMGWQEAADLITAGLSAAIANKEVTYDLARLMEPRVEPVSCSGFADAVIRHFGG